MDGTETTQREGRVGTKILKQELQDFIRIAESDPTQLSFIKEELGKLDEIRYQSVDYQISLLELRLREKMNEVDEIIQSLIDYGVEVSRQGDLAEIDRAFFHIMSDGAVVIGFKAVEHG